MDIKFIVKVQTQDDYEPVAYGPFDTYREAEEFGESVTYDDDGEVREDYENAVLILTLQAPERFTP